MNVTKVYSIVFLGLLAQGCGSLSIKEKVFRNTAIAAAAGYALGSQKDSNQVAYGTMYSGIAAAATALGSIAFYDPDTEIEKFKTKTIEMAKSLDNFGTGPARSPSLGFSGSSSLNSFGNMPEKYRSLVNPGEWRILAIDAWEQIDETHLVHKTEMLEINPPKLIIK